MSLAIFDTITKLGRPDISSMHNVYYIESSTIIAREDRDFAHWQLHERRSQL